MKFIELGFGGRQYLSPTTASAATNHHRQRWQSFRELSVQSHRSSLSPAHQVRGIYPRSLYPALLLLVDVSSSIDSVEDTLQKSGYISAFQRAAPQNAVISSQFGLIVVIFIERSGNAQQTTQVRWTLINSATSSNAFAAALTSISRAVGGIGGSTAIQQAMGTQYIKLGTVKLAAPATALSRCGRVWTCPAAVPTTTAR